MQQRNHFLIFHRCAANVVSNVSNRNTPTLQEMTLRLNHIFIKDIHAAVA